METFNSSVIVCEYDEDGHPAAWVVDADYHNKKPNELPTSKFPSGTNDDHPEDSGDPEKTAKRELFEETGLVVETHNLILVYTRKIGSHTKVWYGVGKHLCSGVLRTKEKREKRSILSPPYLVKLVDLRRYINPNHLPALIEIMKDFERFAGPAPSKV